MPKYEGCSVASKRSKEDAPRDSQRPEDTEAWTGAQLGGVLYGSSQNEAEGGANAERSAVPTDLDRFVTSSTARTSNTCLLPGRITSAGLIPNFHSAIIPMLAGAVCSSRDSQFRDGGAPWNVKLLRCLNPMRVAVERADLHAGVELRNGYCHLVVAGFLEV